MATHTRLRLGAVALVLLVVVLLSGAHLCGVAQDAGSRPLSTGALACTEFWLNRYQTLIGAIVALAAAAVTWIGLRRQIAKADEQIEAASRQSAIALLPILDLRTENALKIHIAASALYGSSMEMLHAAENAFAKAEELRRAYVVGGEVGRMVSVFDDAVKRYKFTIDVFEGRFGKFLEEMTRGVAGPGIRKASGEITIGANDVLDNNRAAYKRLERCTGNRFRSDDEITNSFSAVGNFDPTAIQMPDSAYAIPSELIQAELKTMQKERDQIFDQTRS